MEKREILRRNFQERHRVYRDHPDGIVLFWRELVRSEPTDQQVEAARMFQRSGRIAIKSGHGTGKTKALGVFALHHLFCYPDSLIPCTAPTKHQIFDNLWREAALTIDNAHPVLRQFFTWSPTKIYVTGHRETWHAVGVPSSIPENLSGFHSKHLFYILDEASGIKEEVFPVIEGALTQVGNRIAMISNPTKPAGYFHSLFRTPQGFETATFNSEKSSLVDPEYPKRIARRFGRDSNIFRVRVSGEFPQQGEDTIMGYDEVMAAMTRDQAELGDGRIEIGCDVARYGDDRSEIYIRRGNEIIYHQEMTKQSLARLTGTLLFLIRKFAASACKIDETGIGSGVVDSLIECAKHDPSIACDVIGIANNQKAVDERTYENAGTEMYFQLRDKIKEIRIPNDEDLLGELTVRTYSFHPRSGRILIQDKESLRIEQKKRGLAVCSPDKSDGLALCFYDTGRHGGMIASTLPYDPKKI